MSFSVVGDFEGTSTHIGVFSGKGTSRGRLISGVWNARYQAMAVAYVYGKFTWQTPSGTISGFYWGWDFYNPNYVDESGNPVLFDIAIDLWFTGGTGSLAGARGTGTAVGIDDPYGVTGTSGVVADFQGKLWLP